MSYDRGKVLKEKLACLINKICQLKEKLIVFDEIEDKKNELQAQYSKLKQWCEEVNMKNLKIKNSLIQSLECQTDKVRCTEMALCKLREENNKLLDVNDRVTKKINTLKKNEQQLHIDLNDLETRKKRIENELSQCKIKVEEKKCVVERVSKSLKCQEEEYLDMKRKLHDCKITKERLQEICRNLKMNLESKQKEMETTGCQIKRIEEKLKLEKESLAHELEIKCQKLRVIEMELSEVKRMEDIEKCKVKKLETSIAVFREAYGKHNCETKNKIRWLKKENSAKKEKLCCTNKKIVDLKRKNERTTKEFESLVFQVRTNDCLLGKMIQSMEVVERIKNDKFEQLEKDKKRLACDLQNNTNKLAEMERQVCILTEQNKDQKAKKCITSSFSCPTLSSVESCLPMPRLSKSGSPPCPPISMSPPCPPRSCSPSCPPSFCSPSCPPSSYSPSCPPSSCSLSCLPSVSSPSCSPSSYTSSCPPNSCSTPCLPKSCSPGPCSPPSLPRPCTPLCPARSRLSSSCSSPCTSRCLTPTSVCSDKRSNSIDISNNRMMNELQKLYYDLEKIRESANKCMGNSSCKI